MTVEYIECEQGSEEWFRARMGIPTASEFSTILASGRGGAPSKGRQTYMLKLIGERMSGEPMESYSNAHMERGKAMEAEARQSYAFIHEVEPKLVGFARNTTVCTGPIGASPDSLIADAGTLEVKTKLPHLQLEVLLADAVPEEHVAQVQGQLLVSGREWCDFVSYWPNLPLFVKRVHRDEAYIKTLVSELNRFHDEMLVLETKIKQRWTA